MRVKKIYLDIMSKVLAALSGGVDSAVAAHLLIEEGHEVAGAILRLHDEADGSVEAAKRVAESLGIQLFVLDERKFFEETVIRYFVDHYENCLTPNPCVYCNKHCKFEKLVEFADANGYDFVATGHYARIEDRGGRKVILRGKDRKKDQSYMLYRLTDEQRGKVMFPLGGMTKDEVREEAMRAGLANAKAPDSQDICFLPGGDYAAFVEARATKGTEPGNFVDTTGKVLGRHKGLIHYTVGQRKGLGLALAAPMYVLRKDAERNEVVLCSNDELFTSRVRARLVCIDRPLPDSPDDAIKVTAKIRYSQIETPGRAYMQGSELVVDFDVPVRAPAAGQSLVMYDEEAVVGGGIIAL